MKYTRYLAYLLGILLLTSMFVGLVSNSVDQLSLELNALTETGGFSVTLSYIESSPISIDGDDEFIAQAAINSWPGTGSTADPFLILALNVTSSSSAINLVDIENTNVTFHIQDCLFVGGAIGISFGNVTNGALMNSTIRNCAVRGILAEQSELVMVKNNTIRNCASQGVYFFQSNDSLVYANIAHHNGAEGFLFDYSAGLNISCNTVHHNSFAGIKLRDSDNNSIELNTVYLNYDRGIVLGNSWWTNISRNIVFDHSEICISIESSPYAALVANLVYNGGVQGALLSGSNGIVVGNTFYANGMFGVRIMSDGWSLSENNFLENGIYDDYGAQIAVDGVGHQFSHNYWSDWTAPDNNDDRIVDIPYTIASDYEDLNPHTHAYNDARIHVVTRPMLMCPNSTINGTRFWGSMNLVWGPSSDTFGHSITYSIYISQRETGPWEEVGSGISMTSFEWNTTTVANDSIFLVKVVAVCSEGHTSEMLSPSFILPRHTIAVPTIISPNGGEVFSFRVFIGWEDSLDSWNHEVTYSVYYSSDGGGSWTLVDEMLNSTEYTWFSYEVPDGSNYMVRVVATCSDGLSAEDASDGVFTIDNMTPYMIRVIIYGVPVIVAILLVVLLYRRRRAS